MDLSASPIETFAGVGCIGNFSPTLVYGQPQLAFFPTLINASRDEISSISTYYNHHIPGGHFKSKAFYQDVGSELFGMGVDAVIAYFVPVYGTIPAAADFMIRLAFLNELMNTIYGGIPTWNNIKISKEVYFELIDRMRVPNLYIVGNNVTVTNSLFVFSSYNKDPFLGNTRKGSDQFLSDEDVKGVCRNVNSNNKYLVKFTNIPHFSSFRRESLAEHSLSQKVISDFVNNHSIMPDSEYESSQNCEVT